MAILFFIFITRWNVILFLEFCVKNQSKIMIKIFEEVGTLRIWDTYL